MRSPALITMLGTAPPQSNQMPHTKWARKPVYAFSAIRDQNTWAGFRSRVRAALDQQIDLRFIND